MKINDLISYCHDQINGYNIELEHDMKIHNFEEAAEDKGRIEAYQDIINVLNGKKQT